MARSSFPPYFVPVALTCTLGVLPLSCALALYLGNTSAAQAARALEQEQQIVEAKALDAVPRMQTVRFKSLQHEIVVDGSSRQGKQLRSRLKTFRRTIRDFERAGHRVGVVIYDLGSGSSLTYNADEPFYPASSIKGPHLLAVYEQLVETGEASLGEVNALAEPIMLYSDNEAYGQLCRTYGNQVFADWAVMYGVTDFGSETYQNMSQHNYPVITTRQLSRMWRHGFDYLDSQTEASQQLEQYIEERVESPIRAGLADADLTLTKAGWYPSYDGGGSAPSTCDAGIVVDDDTCYVVAIMTDASADLPWLSDLVPGIYDGRRTLY